MSGKGGKGGAGRHVFKVLCPEALVSSVIGPRGTTKEELQAETGCKLIVSNRDDFYPGTRLRMLVIYCDNPSGIVSALERIVQNIGHCAEKEQLDPHAVRGNESDFLGKEPGECVLRAAIPTKASGAIIGSKGANIQAIREEFNARVFIDRGIEQGHQVLRLVATLENMRMVALRINDCVQEECQTDAFREWAALRSFSGVSGGGYHEKGGGHHEKGGGYDSGKGAEHQHWGKGGGRQESRGGGRPRSRSRGRRDSAGSQRMGAMQALAAAIADFPEGGLDEEQHVTCDLPRDKVSALIGKSGEHVRSVRKDTNTNIHFDEAKGSETQTMTIKGRLMDVYRAHALMMRKYHESDAERQAEAVTSAHVSDLQAQLADLQKQLTAVAKGTGKGSGKSSGKKGR